MAEKKTENKAEKKTKSDSSKKKTKAVDLSGLTKDELLLKTRELQAKLFDLKIKRATSQLEDHSEMWKARKELARAKTYLTIKDTAPKAASK